MPVALHPAFRQPIDPECVIWRYMDFTKFASMLENEALYIARSDQLGDEFEGSYPAANASQRPWRTHPGIPKDLYEPADKLRADYTKQLRLGMYISCWHMNVRESAGMWRLYARSNEAVAVRSTCSRLANALDETFHLGLVEYLDYEVDWMEERNFYYPFVHKRGAFVDECEIRAVTQRLPLNDAGRPDPSDWTRQPLGIQKKVVLEELIDRVYVAPKAQPWFFELVSQILARHSVHVPVCPSSLDAKPFF